MRFNIFLLFAFVRSIIVMDDVFCIFIGTLENTCELRRHYGLSRTATEAMVVIEAHKVLRDRAPYPPDQVIKDLRGKLAFIPFDAKSATLFVTRVSSNFKWSLATKLIWNEMILFAIIQHIVGSCFLLSITNFYFLWLTAEMKLIF